MEENQVLSTPVYSYNQYYHEQPLHVQVEPADQTWTQKMISYEVHGSIFPFNLSVKTDLDYLCKLALYLMTPMQNEKYIAQQHKTYKTLYISESMEKIILFTYSLLIYFRRPKQVKMYS